MNQLGLEATECQNGSSQILDRRHFEEVEGLEQVESQKSDEEDHQSRKKNRDKIMERRSPSSLHSSQDFIAPMPIMDRSDCRRTVSHWKHLQETTHQEKEKDHETRCSVDVLENQQQTSRILEKGSTWIDDDTHRESNGSSGENQEIRLDIIDPENSRGNIADGKTDRMVANQALAVDPTDFERANAPCEYPSNDWFVRIDDDDQVLEKQVLSTVDQSLKQKQEIQSKIGMMSTDSCDYSIPASSHICSKLSPNAPVFTPQQESSLANASSVSLIPIMPTVKPTSVAATPSVDAPCLPHSLQRRISRDSQQSEVEKESGPTLFHLDSRGSSEENHVLKTLILSNQSLTEVRCPIDCPKQVLLSPLSSIIPHAPSEETSEVEDDRNMKNTTSGLLSDKDQVEEPPLTFNPAETVSGMK